MPAELGSDSRLEIVHVLFMDIVGYSKLLVDEQSELSRRLNEVVRNTRQFRAAEAERKLVRLPTGDGMALVFFDNPEEPVRCAMEISRALRSRAGLPLRMGIHTGPVDALTDVNDRSNVAGEGINMAQRVMDCGDAGHILLSKRVAGDLGQFSKWQGQLHDFGEVEVKHGIKVGVVNFHDGDVGNPAVPEKIRRLRRMQAAHARRRAIAWSLGLLAVVAALGAAFWFQSRRAKSLDTATADLAAGKSIAVLPFTSLSNDEANAFFAGGVQDEILTNLARIADLKVISRTSVMSYKAGAERNIREIGRALRVAHVLEGSVQRDAGRVRVTAQLIDARSDAHIWAEHYDRELADVFAIQSEIAQKIADQLRAKLSGAEKTAIANKPTRDVQAYDLYLRAKEILQNANPTVDDKAAGQIEGAIGLLEQAVERDPNFSLAYCLLSGANLSLYWTADKPPHYRARAEAALQKAMRLAPDAGETHLSQAAFYYYGNLDYDHALEELEIAARALPNNVEVVTLSARIERRLGRWTEAARHFVKAIELDPRDLGARFGASSTYTMMRRYREAIEVADRAIADFPESASIFLLRKGEAAAQAGEIKIARAALEAIPAKDRNDVDALLLWYSCAMSERNYDEARRAILSRAQLPHRENLAPDSLFEGEVARAEGNTEKARAAFLDARERSEAMVREHPEEPLYISHTALADAALGRKDEALREIDKAIELATDPLQRPFMLILQAVVSVRLGERDRALQQLEESARIPIGIDYGGLRFDPEWDSLRGDPRFEKIVSSLAPKL